jgi:hypothetical protein
MSLLTLFKGGGGGASPQTINGVAPSIVGAVATAAVLATVTIAGVAPEIKGQVGGAAETTGTPTTYSYTGYTDSRSVTVPADCNLVAVCYGQYTSTNDDATTITLGGNALTKATSVAGSGSVNGNTGVWYLANPPTGSQTLATTFAQTGGHNIIVVYLKGVYTTSPLRSADSQIAPSNYSQYQQITTDSISCEPGDLAVLVVFDYIDTDIIGDAAPSGSGQTQIAAIGTQYNAAVGTKALSTSGTTTVTGSGNYPGLSGAVFSGGGGAAQVQATVTIAGSAPVTTGAVTTASVTPGAATVAGVAPETVGAVTAGAVQTGGGGQTIDGVAPESVGAVTAATLATTVTIPGSAPVTTGAVTAATVTPGAVTVAGQAVEALMGVTAAQVVAEGGPQTIDGVAPVTTGAVTAGTVIPGAVTVNGVAPVTTGAVTAGTVQATVTVVGVAPAAVDAVTVGTVVPGGVTLDAGDAGCPAADMMVDPAAVVPGTATVAGQPVEALLGVTAGAAITEGSPQTINGVAVEAQLGVTTADVLTQSLEPPRFEQSGGGSDVLPLRVRVTDLRKRTERVASTASITVSGKAKVERQFGLPESVEPIRIPAVPPAPKAEPKPPKPEEPKAPEITVKVLTRTKRVHTTARINYAGSATIVAARIKWATSGGTDIPPSRQAVVGFGGVLVGGAARVIPFSYLSRVRQDDEDVLQLLLESSVI